MLTTLLKANANSILKAATLIRDGEVVAIPTETVYGLGANALDTNAVKKIFAAKGRPGDNPLIVHIAHMDELSALIACSLTDAMLAVMDAFWPGPLTLIFKKSDRVPFEVTAGLETVAIRMPDHEVAKEIISLSGCPIAAPSANKSGRPSPTSAAHVYDDLNGEIPLIIDGGQCQVGLESTVLDMTGDLPRILRPGGVTLEMLEFVLGEVLLDDSILCALKEGEQARSPGMKYKHYAPIGELTLVSGEDSIAIKKICTLYDKAVSRGLTSVIIASDETISCFGDRMKVSLGSKSEPQSMAAQLFNTLRDMDDVGAQIIFAQVVDTKGIGLALMNRLGKAAGFKTINAGE